MLDLSGPELSPEDRERIAHPATGGIILFSRNYQSPEQSARLVASVRDIRPGLLIAVDHEGGRVQRFRFGFTRLPPASVYAASAEPTRMAETAGWLMAAELRSLDVDFSFAPVLDVDCGVSEIIADRAFGADPVVVSELATAFARGMKRAGMAAVGKHYPGHGGVAADSHLELPVDARPLEDLERRDLVPFRALIAEGLEGVMPAHVVYSSVDPQPTGFSRFWLEEILRHRLGFRGAIFSDDLSMAGAAFAGSYVERARLALEAGCDMVLVCNAPAAADQVLAALAGEVSNPVRQGRLERMRGGVPWTDNLSTSEEWRNAVHLIESLNPNQK